MHRIVHLDLKGAPLKLQYLDKVLECVKQWGATGVLVEWEDTFPYSGDLSIIGSNGGCGGDGMYTMEEVQKILQSIKEKGLEPIQLVQTIGHMEFVLKHPPFRELREEPRSPAVLCPSKAKSLYLVREMLQNVLDAQPDAKYFHIGADEVWHTGICEDCQRRAALGEQKSWLYLNYIRDVLVFLKTLRPKLNILMWDDMLRTINLETLEKSNIGKMVEPVIWNYNISEHFYIAPDMWRTYDRVFSKLWAGSAYKGANGSCQALSPVARYTSNQAAWVRELQRNPDINFTGVILTGWSRFDHYATLCELMPVALPSLYSCLSVWIQPTADISEVTCEGLPEHSWPGYELARCVHTYVMLKERVHQLNQGDAVKTWLTPWQVDHGYTSPMQVEGIAGTAHELLTNLQSLEREASVQLQRVTGRRSAEEWLGSHVGPLLGEMTRLHQVAARRANVDASVAPLT